MTNDKVTVAVTEIAQTFKAQIKAYVVEYLGTCVQQWKDDCNRTGFTDPSFIYPTFGNIGRQQSQINTQRKSVLRPFLTSVNIPVSEWINKPIAQREQLRYSLRENYKAIIEQKAERQAEDAIQSFIAKMSSKLQGLIDAKGGLVTAETDGSLHNNAIRITFQDGTCFTLVNSMTLNVSSRGKVFNQYPARFHQVVYYRMDGSVTRYNVLSESEIKSLFGVKE